MDYSKQKTLNAIIISDKNTPLVIFLFTKSKNCVIIKSKEEKMVKLSIPEWNSIFKTDKKVKGWGIFDSSRYKEHKVAPMKQLFWKMRYTLAIWILLYIVITLSFVAEHFFRYGFSAASTKWMGLYFHNLITSYGMSPFSEVINWFHRAFFNADWPVITPVVGAIVIWMLLDENIYKEFNPYGDKRESEGASHKATEDDIKKMGNKDNKNGLFSGFMFVLGKFKNKYLKLDETLSALCVAPPGTGKTTAIVVPTLLECDTVSMIVNDPKPELDKTTSGYRSTIGPVFIINWAGHDEPDAGVYYPSWNPLSPEHVPNDPSDRDLYVDSMVAVLVKDKKGSSADPHWTLSGRAALSGFIHFIISKCEKARANDYFYHKLKTNTFTEKDKQMLMTFYQKMDDINAEAAMNLLMQNQLNITNYVHVGTWKLMPPSWVGKEASFSMLLDWINQAQINMANTIEEQKRQGDQMASFADPMKDLLEDAVKEARQYGYQHRAVLELTQLANTPDKERGSIFSTFAASINIFKNAAVRARTSHSDFVFDYMRGMIDPTDGKMKPVTVYLSINQVDAQALNPITGMFIELMSRFLIANPPEAVGKTGRKVGPTAVAFLLDEFPKMDPLPALIEGPDIGRGQKVSYLLIGQDLQQIAAQYSKENMETLMSTTAAKIVFRQNNYQTAEIFSQYFGNKNELKVKIDETTKKETEENNEKPLFSPMDIMTLKFDKVLISIQGHANHPIEADAPHWFKTDDLKVKVNMPKAQPLPRFMIEKHHKLMGYHGQPNYSRYDKK